MSRGAAVVAGMVLALGVPACGSEDEASRSAAPREPQRHEPNPADDRGEPEVPATETVAARPGCGELCQQAGPPAGTDNPGCPGDDSDNCAPCPQGGCADVLTRSADVHDGIFTVDLTCKVDHRCAGALHVYVPDSISDPVAASDAKVLPGETASVPIALTSFGRHVVGVTGGFKGRVYVFLERTGVDQLGRTGFTPPTLRLSSRREDLVPCDGGIQVATNTSCPFAQNVFTSYADGAEPYLKAHSPTTDRSYQMSCSSDPTTVYCTGGNDAFVTFPGGER